ncbi:MAG: hypothetical protein ACTHOF_11435 [Flavisolibacter sp.]
MKEQQNRNSNTENRDERNKENTGLSSNAANEPTPIYLTPDSTLQTPEEDRHDKSINPEKDDTLSVSNDDLHETSADRMAGSDRAGTSERKEE